ncbi:uncharacterized protein LOC144411427 [Gasterosteus aculeatus]
MNRAVVIFVDSVEKAREVVASGVVVRGAHAPVLPLAVPAVRVTVANVPPFVPDGVLLEELAKHGKVVSPLKKLSSGCKSPLMRHGHLARGCPERKPSSAPLDVGASVGGGEAEPVGQVDEGVTVGTGEGVSVAIGEAQPVAEGVSVATGEGQPVGQVGEGVTVGMGEGVSVGLGEGQPGDQVGEGETVGLGESQPVGQVGEGVSVGMGEGVSVGLGEGQPGDQVDEGETVGLGESQPVGQVGEGSEGMNVGVDGGLNVAQRAGLCDRVKEGMGALGSGGAVRGGTSDSEEYMEEGGVDFKAPRLKRKTRANRGGSRAKRGGRRGKVGGVESGSSSGWASEDSVSSGGTVSSRHGVGQMKAFLQTTKNQRGVELEDYFSDLEKFARSVRHGCTKKGAADYTQQEVFRLRKINLKITRDGGNGTE